MDDDTRASEPTYQKVHLDVDRLNVHGDYEVAHMHRWPEHVVVDGCIGCGITSLTQNHDFIHFQSLEAFNTWARTCLCPRRYSIAEAADSIQHGAVVRPDGPIVRLNAACPVHGQPFAVPTGAPTPVVIDEIAVDPEATIEVTYEPPLKDTYTREEFEEKVKPWDLTQWCPGPWVEPAQIPEWMDYYDDDLKRERRKWTGRYLPNPAFDPDKEAYCKHGVQHHHAIIQTPAHNWRPDRR